MSTIPVHVQRRFEQKWASRFPLPVVSTELKSVGTKTIPGSPARAAKTEEKARRREPAPRMHERLTDPQVFTRRQPCAVEGIN
jgi:hypothetical protein